MSEFERERDVLGPLRPAPGDLAFMDGLTGLYNQRYLTTLLEDHWTEVVELSGSLAMVMIDLNLFKVVNDRYGHLSGDEVLRLTAELLREHFRESDLVCRYGGDEFIALLPGATASEAEALVNRAKSAMQSFEFLTPEEKEHIKVPISFSIGVSVYPDDGESGRVLLAAADERLYAEKRARGRTRKKQRMLVVGSAILVAAMALTAGFLYLFEQSDDSSAGSSTPEVVVRPIRVETLPTDLPERVELMAEIEALQAQMEALLSEQASAPEPDAAQIGKLERKIQELSARLRTSDEGNQPPVQETPQIDLTIDEMERPVAMDSVEVGQVKPSPPAAIVAPYLIDSVKPVYPPFAKERGIEATIVLEISIDVEGRVLEAVVTSVRIGFGFEEAAQKAAMASRWKPAQRDGVPIPMKTTLEVRFKSGR